MQGFYLAASRSLLYLFSILVSCSHRSVYLLHIVTEIIKYDHLVQL